MSKLSIRANFLCFKKSWKFCEVVSLHCTCNVSNVRGKHVNISGPVDGIECFFMVFLCMVRGDTLGVQLVPLWFFLWTSIYWCSLIDHLPSSLSWSSSRWCSPGGRGDTPLNFNSVNVIALCPFLLLGDGDDVDAEDDEAVAGCCRFWWWCLWCL